MAKLQARPTVGLVTETFRMGTKAEPLTDQDKQKAVTLAGPTQVDLAGADDEIFGFVTSIESGTQDGFKTGGVQVNDYAYVDTGNLDVGTVVVVDSNPAKGTSGQTVVKAAAEPEKVVFKWIVIHPGVVKRV